SQSDKINQITSDVNGTKQSITDIQTKDGKQDTRMGTIETSVSGVKSDFSTYKADANGRIGTAQTTAQTAVDGLKNKVSQTDYNTKTGQLQTDLTTTTQTANKAKTDIVSIKQKDGEQDEKMNTIVSDANGTKQTVSDLKTAQDKQSGYISTLQQRADGFEATVTKVDNLAVGGRNLLLGTDKPWTLKANDNNWHFNPIYNHLKGGTTYTFSAEISVSNGQDSVSVDAYDGPIGTNWGFSDNFSKGVKRGSFTFTTPDHIDKDGHLLVYAGTAAHTAGLSATYTHMKLEEGNVPTAWAPAPEDVDNTISKVKQTADEASTAVSKLTSADGIITKAQADIKANADAITEKVSRTVYDQKTGELSRNVNEAKNTADKSLKTIADIQEADGKRDSRISDIEHTAGEIKSTVSDLSNEQGKQSGYISTLQQRAGGFDATVTKVNNLAVGSRNLLIGTNSNTKSSLNTSSGVHTTQYVAFGNGYKYNFSYTTASTTWAVYMFSGLQKDKFKPNTDYVLSFMANVSTDINPGVLFANESSQHNFVKQVTTPTILSSNGDQKVVIQLRTNATIPDDSDQSLYIKGFVNKVGTFSIWDLKIETGNIATDWTPAPEDLSSASAHAQFTADQASAAISKLTSADGIITKAQADIKANADAITEKVSRTVYDQKTGELSRNVNEAKNTADKSLKTIADIQEADGKRDSRISDIEHTAGEIKSTVSDLSNEQGKQSGYISTLQQRAGGFDATVTKVNNLAVGSRNLLIGTNSNTKSSLNTSSGVHTTQYVAFGNGYKYNFSYTTASTTWAVYMFSGLQKDKFKPNTDYVLSFMANVSTDINPGVLFANESSQHNFVKQVTTPTILSSNGDQKVVIQLRTNATIPDDSDQSLYIKGFVNKVGTFSIWDLKIETGNIATDWTPAPEDLSSASAHAQFTADQASAAISKLTSADGIITKAQADIKANADAITEKVSRTVYDQKTGELSRNINEAKDTADKSLRTIGDYKTSNDKRVHGAESSIERTANAITEKVSRTVYDKKTGELSENLSELQRTADSISTFVRDSSGNISSNFQTALSRTSIITGSTLATSIKKETATQISSALADNNGKIISLINQDSSGVQIAGENIILDGTVSVLSTFWAKQINAMKVNANNITVGTLNGNQVNITNINANNIVSGAISGANLNINLNTGSVVFQKGRINSSDYTTDINIDQGYISTANDNTRALIKQGMIQLVAPNRFDLDSSPYMELSNNRGVGTAGAAIIGRDSVSIANSKNAKNIFPAPIGTETFSGLYTGQASDGGWLPTKVAGADRGVVVAGGTETTWQVVNSSPYIWVGSNATGSSGYGNRVAIEAEYLHATTVYNHYASGGANVYVASDGALVKSSSATKYKTNIEHETDSIQGDQLLTIDPATWNDKFESEQLERYHEIGVEPERQINMEGKRYYGIIAEDLVKAGLEELVTRNEETNEVEGVEYSKIGVALIPIVRDLRNKLNEQAVEIERLKDKNK
ncbi:gp58-like family protein, partial [Leuconostoc mesenteroides]|uniref:gp58-like family protein n=1 Tax=Leuconostoc mesenteroides TaxID=1245 RepID=UPI001CBB0DF6